jgi:hypothetical protein
MSASSPSPPMNPATDVTGAQGLALSRDSAGQLLLQTADHTPAVAVTAVRPFPISEPQGAIALVDRDGHELAWLDSVDQLEPGTRDLILEELRRREFMPHIEALESVSSFITPSTWQVRTDRGPTSFVLGGEEFIRRLSGGTLLIADTHGIHYLIRDFKALDRESRKLLDRFL